MLSDTHISVRMRLLDENQSGFPPNDYPRFLHDYLWFNVSKLGHGLILLAEGFLGEYQKLRKAQREQLRKEEDGLCIGAWIDWAICECNSGSFRGVELTVAQYWKTQVQVNFNDRFDAFDVVYPFPTPQQGNPKGKIAKAYTGRQTGPRR